MSRFQKFRERRWNRYIGKNPFRILDEFDHWFEFERRRIFEHEKAYMIAADMLRFDPERLRDFYGPDELRIEFDEHGISTAFFSWPVIHRASYS